MPRIQLQAKGVSDLKDIKRNVKASKHYDHVTWGVLDKPPCAVVGGGPGLEARLKILREWKGDIFAVNDTAGYLSQKGIPCYLYSIDATEVPFKIGPLVKGAVLASRCHQVQFKLFKRRDVRIFHMADDNNGNGTEGGPTSVCRTPHLLLRMGYAAIAYFGFDGCFYDKSHAGDVSEATRKAAKDNLIVVTCKGVDYLSNAALMMQCEYLADVMKKYPQFLINASGGMLEAMIKNPDDWTVTAISEGLKKQYEAGGVNIWSVDYKLGEKPIWRPQTVGAGG